MDFSTIVAFTGAAFVLPIIVQMIRNAVYVPDRFILPILVGLAALWGIVLYFSNLVDVTPAVFVVQVLVTAITASGVHGQAATYFPNLDTGVKKNPTAATTSATIDSSSPGITVSSNATISDHTPPPGAPPPGVTV